MIKNELKSLWNNKLLMLVLVAIMLIPALYAGLFLASMWDPYGDLQYLPVAVVNKDKPVDYNGKELKIGENLVNNLKNNDSMAFNVVDEETAKNGLLNGTYYMVVTVPENFSKNASTVMDSNPQKMVLDYETNPGKNYISMKLSESAMKEIKSNLTEEISKTYAETVFDSIQSIGDGFEDAIDGTEKMVDGENELAKGNETITDNLEVLAKSTLTFKEGTDTLEKGIEQYTNGVDSVDKGVENLDKGTKKFSSQVVPGAKKLSKGAGTLQSGIQSYTEGVASANEGSGKLKQGSSKLLEGLETMQTQMNTSLTKENADSIKALSNQALPGIKNGIDQLYEGLSVMDMNALSSLGELGSGIQSAGGYASTATSSVSSAKDLTMSAVGNVMSAGGSIEQAKKIVSSVNVEDFSEDDKNAVLEALGSASASISDAAGSLGENGVAKQLAVAEGNLGGTQQTLSVIGELLKQFDSNLPTKLSALSEGVTQLHNNAQYLTVASDTMNTLLGSLTSVQSALNATQKNSGNSGLVEGMQILNAGIGDLDNGLGKLGANNEGLQNGASSLKDGADTLYSGLKSGFGQISSGVCKLQNGTNQLVKNNDSLINGAKQLSSGATKISDGADKLCDGSKELGDGLNTLQDGTLELNDAMVDGEKEIREKKASDATIDMFSAPVEVSETQITKVENNGHAMAAYMFSVGLWVGCLAFCLMYPLASYKGKLTSGRAWWASKAIVLYPLAILMVAMLLTILQNKIGFKPASMTKTFIVGVATVSAFMSIMYFFNLLLGKVGSFLMLIFMVLQLAGSAGTYPVEISGNLANALHKWVPFTYSVDAFRAAIAENGPSVTYECSLLFMIAIVFTLLTIAVFKIRARRVLEGKTIVYDWLEKKGLA